jgi:peptide chain release factor 1
VTDHRIGLTLHSIDTFLMGDIEEMVEALKIADREAKLSAGFDEE